MPEPRFAHFSEGLIFCLAGLHFVKVSQLVRDRLVSCESSQEANVLNQSESEKVTQLCPILCDPMDYTVHGILQARILEWVDIYSLPGNLPNPGIEPRSPALQVDSLPDEPQGKPSKSGISLLLYMEIV